MGKLLCLDKSNVISKTVLVCSKYFPFKYLPLFYIGLNHNRTNNKRNDFFFCVSISLSSFFVSNSNKFLRKVLTFLIRKYFTSVWWNSKRPECIYFENFWPRNILLDSRILYSFCYIIFIHQNGIWEAISWTISISHVSRLFVKMYLRN